MSDLIGKAVIAVEANTTGLKAGMAEGAQSVKQFEATATASGAKSSAAFKGMSDAATTGARASESSIRSFMASLERQSVQVSQGKAAWMEMRAAQLGVAESAAPLIAAMKNAESGAHKMNFATAGARKEMLVLAHEASTGAWKNFGGSLMVLGERTDALAAIMSPAGLAVGALVTALGTAALAAFKGAEEESRFNQAIIMTGSYAGLTRGNLEGMADAIALSGNNVGKAKEALLALAESGKFTGGQIAAIAPAVTEMAEYTGVAVKDVVAQFEKLADDPAKASAKLNEQYHYLTLSVYEQIAALEKQGDKIAAAGVAEKAWADAANERVGSIKTNLGYLATAWHGVGDAASSAWSKMMGLGKTETTEQKIANLQNSLKQQQDYIGFSPDGLVKNTMQEISLLQEKLRLEQRSAEAKAREAKTQVEGIAAEQRIEQLREKIMTNAQRRQKEIDQLDHDRAAKLAAGRPLSDAEYSKMVANINERYPDKKNDSAAQNAINGRLEALQQQYKAEEDALKANLAHIKSLRDQGLMTVQDQLQQEFDARQQALAKELGIVQQQEEIAKGKRQLSAYQKYAGEEAQIRQKIAENNQKFADDSALLRQKEARDLEAYTATLTKSLQTRQDAITQSVQAVGMGDVARDQFSRLNQAAKEYDDKFTDLTRRRIENKIDPSGYNAELKALKEYYDQRVAMEYGATERVRTAQGDWFNGANRAFENYRDNAGKIADHVSTSFTSLYDGLTDAAAKWATGTKVSIGDIGAAFAQELIKMQLRAAATPVFGALTGMLGSWFGGAAGGASGGAGGAAATASAKGNVFASGAVVHAFAKGGAFTNSVVSSPSLAPMALFGEAGPEAIMPLSRGADGSLGVRASIDAGASSSDQPSTSSSSVRVEIVNEGQQPMQVKSATPVFDASGMILRVVLDNIQRGGALRSAIQNVPRS